MLISDLSTYFLYISLSLFNFYIKLLSFTEPFFYKFISFSSCPSPLFMTYFNFYISYLYAFICNISSFNYLHTLCNWTCLSFYWWRLFFISPNYFYFIYFIYTRLLQIYFIYSYFFNYTAYYFYNLFNNFFYFSIVSYISWYFTVIYLNLTFDCLLSYFVVAYFTFA